MTGNSARYGIAGWCGIAGGVATPQDWLRWARNQLNMRSTLPKPQLESVPPQIRRRLDVLGRCVMFACEQCLPLIKTEPAIICVSRHGDLPLMEKLVQCARDHLAISPTEFVYSVHNRFSSLVSLFAGYHGVNGAYSSVRDGFPLALAEATALLDEGQARRVLVIAYESEIPDAYRQIISTPWSPHVVAWVLQMPDDTGPTYSLLRHTDGVPEVSDGGSCLPLVKTMLNKTGRRDGFWEYRYEA